MQIKNAYAVNIDFDGDIYSSTVGFKVFAGEEAYDEVKELVRIALKDINDHENKIWGLNAYAYVHETDRPITEILNDDDLLDAFIVNGGAHFGNWDIEIMHTEDDM